MYIVTLENNGISTEIHGMREKLASGKIVKGINSIDTFSFSLLPSNAGWNEINDFTTLVKVYNTNRDRFEFFGRVLYSDNTMSDSGLITKEVTCESYFGFFCDSQQDVVGEKNWTVLELFRHIIDKHNSQIEEYKKFTIGEVTVTDPNDNVYIGIQYANTWDTIREKLVEKLGGEISLRVVDGVNYIDYLAQAGKISETEIAVSHNMKSIKQERDPSDYITRLIPLGMKMGENDERLTIAEVNDGKNYIDDNDAILKYGIHVGYVEWDDVTEASNLLTKGAAWLEENNKLKIKYSITALDLSLLGLDIDDFDVCNYHPIKNHLLGIDDVARIVKKSIDVCEEVKSTIEVGENLKSASDIQISAQQEAKKVYSKITKTADEIKLEVVNEINGVRSELDQTAESLATRVENAEGDISAIEQTVNNISLSVSESSGADGQVYASITLRVGDNMYTGQILMEGNLNVSGQLSADALYAALGNVADLTVDKLSTSRRIKMYLAGDTDDDNYVLAQNEELCFMSGVYAGGTEQATLPNGELIYWESNPNASGVSLGTDGYPYLDGVRIFTTTTKTNYPVMVYTYNELAKAKIAFEMVDGIYTPVMTMGAGNAGGYNQGRIVKGTNGLEILFTPASGGEIGIKMGNDGYTDILGLRRITGLNFSEFDSGVFYERIAGDSERYAYNVEFDSAGNPIKITDNNGHECYITW